jgi:hypothetical protein
MVVSESHLLKLLCAVSMIWEVLFGTGMSLQLLTIGVVADPATHC